MNSELEKIEKSWADEIRRKRAVKKELINEIVELARQIGVDGSKPRDQLKKLIELRRKLLFETRKMMQSERDEIAFYLNETKKLYQSNLELSWY